MHVARLYSAFQLARRPWIRTQNGKTKWLWTNSKYHLPDSGLIGIPQLNLHPSWRYRAVFPFKPSPLLRLLFPCISGTIRTEAVFTRCPLQPSRCCVRVESHNCLKCKHWLCHRAPGRHWQSSLRSLTPFSPSIKRKWLTLHPNVYRLPRSRTGTEQTRTANHYSRPHPEDATEWKKRPTLLGSVRETLEDIENYRIKLNFTLSWDRWTNFLFSPPLL